MVGAKKTFKMKIFHNINRKKSSGFTLIELIIGIGIMATLSGLVLPSFLNWIRTEKVNAYTRELREYFRVVRLNARRWGSSCNININEIAFSDISDNTQKNGFSINCSDQNTKISAMAPSLNNSIFQVLNNDFKITPNGRISSEESIVIVIGSRYHEFGSKILNCLIIQAPTGHIVKGKFTENDWITNDIKASQIDTNNILTSNKCIQ